MIKFIDLFAGIGGIRIAFERNNAKCVFSSEIDKDASITYFENFGDIPSGDIKLVKSEEIEDFDILTGGFPCQPFSIAGLRKGFDDVRGTLFFEIARIINDKKPKAFLLENVAGIVNHDKGNTIKVIENVLDNLGYKSRWKLMNAKDYGIPQNRNRWYCVGFRNDLNITFEKDEKSFKFPSKIDLKYSLNDVIDNVISLEYKISDIAKENICKYIDSKLDDKNELIAYDIRASRCLFRYDGISPCLTAKMGTGGNNVPVLVAQNRKLTEKECLALMGFPKEYKIKANSSKSYKQIGNSVVVPVIELIAKEMIRVLEENI